MGGEYFYYAQHRIKDIEDGIHRLIRTNNDESVNEWGDRLGRFFTEDTLARFRLAKKTLRIARKMAHEIALLGSYDTGESDFHESWNEEIMPLLEELEEEFFLVPKEQEEEETKDGEENQ